MPTLKTISGVEPYPKPVMLGEDVVFIGRAKICKIVLKDKLTSRKHAKIFKIGDQYYVEDLKSRNGTILNGQKIDNSRKLVSGDIIKVGEHEIIFDTTASHAPGIANADTPTKVKSNHDEIFIPSDDVPFGAPGTVYCLNFTGGAGSFTKVLLKPVSTIGRGDEADIHIDEVLASRLHFQLEIKASGLKLVDLESRNGTKVNDEFVNQQYLDKGDVISIGNTKIVVSSRLPLTTGEYQELQIEEALEKNMDIQQLIPTGNMNVPDISDSLKEKVAQVVPILQYQLEDGSDRSFSLHTSEVTIGRSDEATLTIADKLSSRVHAKISRDDDRFFVEDLNSRNGTKINNREVKGKIELLPGDKIFVGEVEFTFILPVSKAQLSSDSATSIAPAIQDNLAQLQRVKHKVSREKRIKKQVSEPTDYTGFIIAGVIIAVVLILALVLIINNEGSNTGFPEEPEDNNIAKDKNKDRNTNYNNHKNYPIPYNNNGTNKPDNKDDDDKDEENNTPKKDNDKELTEDEIDERWIWAAPNDFEEKVRQDYINVKEKVRYDLLDGENFGTAYILVNERIAKYQNKDLDYIIKLLQELLVLIDKKANEFWEGYLRDAIKNTPEDKRVMKFKDEIIDAFEGYDKYFEPAMQMIGN